MKGKLNKYKQKNSTLGMKVDFPDLVIRGTYSLEEGLE